MDEIPCLHVMVAIKKWHMDTYEYCSIYYKKQTYIDTYKSIVNTVGNPDEWEIPRQAGQIKVDAPLEKRTTRRDQRRLDSYHVENSRSII